jgi:tRNA nucleotidyltransferase/poly(A) polymerase
MFYDPIERKVIDYVNGRADLKSRIIRTIGVARERFGEDYLRMLRAVRFATQLGFKIEPATRLAISRNANSITKISGERIAAELEGILVDPHRVVGAKLLTETGLAEVVFPGFTGRKAKLAISVLAQLRKKVDFALALGSFFAGCTAEFALESCHVLKLSRNQTKHLKFLLANRGKLLDDKISLARLRMIVSEPYFWDLYELQKAIQKTSGAGRSAIAPLMKLRRRIRALGDIELRPKALLNGHDLMRLGAVSGPGLGQLAEEMYIAQLDGTLKTTKQARQWAKKWLDRHKTPEGNT